MSVIIRCRGVEKIYRQGAVEVPALRGVDVDLVAGDFATLSGPSGSGKTTLLSLIGGLDRPTAGDILVDGAPVAKMDGSHLAELRLHKIGFVSPQPNAFKARRQHDRERSPPAPRADD